MKLVRIAVLLLAVAAAGGAVMLAMSPKPEPVQVSAPPPPPATTDQILVAAKELPIGKVIAADDLTWQSWPKDAVAAFMIKKDDKVVADLTGSIVRSSFYAGEPIRRERLIKGSSGFLSAVLPSGMRAVAINIDTQGSASAGNFILPGDRVDVVRTIKSSAPNSSDFVSETFLTNVLVRAIGQNVQDKDGQTVVVGSTATLELDPVQAETVILAQRTGQLSLTLRSMLDAAQNSEAVHVADGKTTIIRFGVESDGASH